MCLYCSINSTTVNNTIACNWLVSKVIQSCVVMISLYVEVPLRHIQLTSIGSENSNYVTADELASTWQKLGIDATNEEVENFIEVCSI